jgi:AraC-like DNA-binding protein
MFFERIQLDKELVIEKKVGERTENKLHMHDVLEIHVLFENDALFKLADKQYEGKPGDVFLFRPFEPHWNLVKDREKPIRWISILFSPSIVRIIPNGYQLLAPFYAVETISPYIHADSECAKAIQQLAFMALSEQQEKRLGWECKQYIYFFDILAHLIRHTMEYQDHNQSNLDHNMLAIIQYFLEHFTEPLDINKAIELTGKQRTFFYSKFKAITGLTPNRFISRLRLQTAIFQLISYEKPITQIAYDCGYESINYFNKCFRQEHGMSPRDFRRTHKNLSLNDSGLN